MNFFFIHTSTVRGFLLYSRHTQKVQRLFLWLVNTAIDIGTLLDTDLRKILLSFGFLRTSYSNKCWCCCLFTNLKKDWDYITWRELVGWSSNNVIWDRLYSHCNLWHQIRTVYMLLSTPTDERNFWTKEQRAMWVQTVTNIWGYQTQHWSFYIIVCFVFRCISVWAKKLV